MTEKELIEMHTPFMRKTAKYYNNRLSIGCDEEDFFQEFCKMLVTEHRRLGENFRNEYIKKLCFSIASHMYRSFTKFDRKNKVPKCIYWNHKQYDTLEYFDKEINHDKCKTLQDKKINIEEHIYSKQLYNIIEQSNLTEREKYIILKRIEGYYLNEIGEKYNISSERVRQLISKSHAKIKNMNHTKYEDQNA